MHRSFRTVRRFGPRQRSLAVLFKNISSRSARAGMHTHTHRTTMEKEYTQRFGAAADSVTLPPHMRKRAIQPVTGKSSLLAPSIPDASAPENMPESETTAAPAFTSVTTKAAADAASATPDSSFATYNQDILKQIGVKCANKLPPASAIQAMFLYEMQRQTEAEKLFHAQMFELAKAEDHTHVQDRRIKELEARLALLERKMAARDVDERIATSNVRLNAHQEKLNACSGRLGWAEQKLATVDQRLDELKKRQDDATLVAAAAALSPAITVSNAHSEDVATMKEEINVLFDDRDGILNMVKEVKENVARLDLNIKQLIVQQLSSTSSSPASTHRIPIKNPNGDLVELSVPKGSSFSLKENRGPVQSFQPGKQWGT
ncbi:hypothetical protein AC579_9931 [Pseudocercospora musae]|uniref:Uncharacterized protein n=1 Tax=Pseudocercospora musae TaxID=113226 RepID=A0A139I3I3_9PEZI|nr:hypothetical protein AC579_9931 [Pseudocercospora musae]